ncbi:uncharacterized protein LACBIDRAFT_297983 [Laccaria bicolor S238N-H82]|uniref:Predicted protein n=1 Tax=Laccaria bicolor (strain S238N-H82 / ATCC MYA-4686) TaxID=486041 RepID=B0DBZ8_LACBS|nr:uncharacterized protein LACBIDRAFT_297983 [Laccaria bicolor S238N-H82]EDR07807.1 predicted protein [Laccaria bicolor S238N-H82]|eukprot:XP_001881596.1 predicted protein [Laccaria bicolor S238N-H82]
MSPTPTTQATEEEILLRVFQAATRTAQHVIVIAGAGLSAASDGGGLWRSLDATSLATPSASATNPSLVWQFYHYRRVKAFETRPNKAHNLLAKLSVPSFLKTVAPAAKTYHLITQNVDGLSTTALQMHGRIFNVKCTECDYCAKDLSNPLCPSLDVSNIGSYHDAGSKEVDIPES